MTINDYTYEILNNYFSLLGEEGYASIDKEYKIIILDIIDGLVNGECKNCISKESYDSIIYPLLERIVGSDCIFVSPSCYCN